MTWHNAKQDVRRRALTRLLEHDFSKISILEFGAFASPTFYPDDGTIFYADRLSSEELKQTVSDPEKREAIVDVDFVVPPDFSADIGKTFDLIIANHVVEHVPDVVGWLNNIARALRDNGHLFLSVPDKNYTFDIMRDPTLIRELLDNYVTHKSQPSIASIVDARYNRRDIVFGSDVWQGKAHRAIARKPSIDVGKLIEEIRKRHELGDYIDAHCNVFTEMSFSEVFTGMDKFGICNLRLVATQPVERPFNEFYALFQKN